MVSVRDERNSSGERQAGTPRSRSLRERYLRMVDASIPEPIRQGDPQTLRRARIVVSFAIALVVLGLETIVFFHWTLPWEASLELEISLVAALLAVLLVPVALRRFHSVALAANLVIGGSFLVIATTIVLLGGITAPILHWCALMPMLAILMGTRRSAWCWGGVSGLAVGALAYAGASGIDFPSYLAESQLTGAKLWMQRMVDVSSWIGILLAIAILYERHKDAQTAELAAINAELTREIVQRKRAEERTHYLAYYDELTTLPNRQLFKQQLERAMARARREERMIGVLFLDLDGFKEVNDCHGHDLGDLLLRAVAERLLNCIRGADSIARVGVDEGEQVVSRLGGDEFTILLVNIRRSDEAMLVAKRILSTLARPFRIEGREVSITASIGIALHPTGHSPVETVEGVLKNADVAMYHAKRRGRNTCEVFREALLRRQHPAKGLLETWTAEQGRVADSDLDVPARTKSRA